MRIKQSVCLNLLVGAIAIELLTMKLLASFLSMIYLVCIVFKGHVCYGGQFYQSNTFLASLLCSNNIKCHKFNFDSLVFLIRMS